MKSIISVVVVSFAMSLPAVAATAKRTCNIPESFDSDTYEDVGDQKSIFEKMQLSRTEAVQILIAARHEADTKSSSKIKNASDAISYLKDASEGGDALIGYQQANGVVYSVVLYYPGGNPVGVIFAKDSTRVVGYIEDSSVECK